MYIEDIDQIVKNFPDEHYAEIDYHDGYRTLQKRIVFVKHRTVTDNADGKEKTLPFCVDNPEHPSDTFPLYEQHSPEDLGTYESIVHGSPEREKLFHAIVESQSSRPHSLTIIQAMVWAQKRMTPSYDLKLLARQAMSVVFNEMQTRKEEEEKLLALIGDNFKRSTENSSGNSSAGQ